MTELNKKELSYIIGGVKYTILGLFAGLITFILSFIDGFIRPISCKG